MKTVGEFKKAGVVFVKGDLIDGHTNNKKSESCDPFIFYGDIRNWSLMWTMRSFAWRDLTTKPDNPQYKIELDIDNHRWRPSLNQGVEQRVSTAQVKQPEFKVGDLVVVTNPLIGDKHYITLTYLDNKSFVGYVDEWLTGNSSEVDNPLVGYLEHVSIEHYNPELEELKNIIGTHDDPTECAKAILAAGYKK